jgi:exosortase A
MSSPAEQSVSVVSAKSSVEPAVTLSASQKRAWSWHLLALALLATMILVVYRGAAQSMVAVWIRSDTFAHGFLVPPISGWLIWRLRSELAAITPTVFGWALLPLGAGAALLWVGELLSANAVTHFGLVGALVCLVPLTLGQALARRITFPLVFLFFCVPFGEFLLPVLMEATADFAVAALEFSGVPVYREGLQFVIPSGNWSVVEACSGVRYLIASFMVGSLFAYLNYQTSWRRWTFVGFSLLMPILANWVRAYLIVMIGHLSGNTLAVGVDHLIYGWVFFGLVIMLMFWVGSRWSEPERASPNSPAINLSLDPGMLSTRSVWLLSFFAAVILLIGPTWVALEDRSNAAIRTIDSRYLNKISSAWMPISNPSTLIKPIYVEPSAEVFTHFKDNTAEVALHIAYYRGQTHSRKLASSQNVLLRSEDSAWQLREQEFRTIATNGGPSTVRVTRIGTPPSLVSGKPPTVIAWQLMWVDGTWVADPAKVAIQVAKSKLRGRGDDAAGITIYTRAEEDSAVGVEKAQRVLNKFLVDILPSLESSLLQTQRAR